MLPAKDNPMFEALIYVPLMGQTGWGFGLELCQCANNFDLIYLTKNLTMSHQSINIDCNVTKITSSCQRKNKSGPFLKGL